MTPMLHHLPFGEFEREQHTAANLGRVFDGLQTRR